ncbi:hypothetical protein PPERSA_06121 [Pseudocohnilembus persalinus]|uniref:Uncharacterized protein n=1 Tax=Pseudocohnilembus persalinus TaxID=266149 RepID=A0A0V0QV89_PSEPJ|nr:hypothetical protein PPERSA_06121 [Pseudocohnilembus persalinus]|eukprot:KRX06239.1 hypothetical protein PPERSA_06121 [Pseudocohnilembus persalinus]
MGCQQGKNKQEQNKNKIIYDEDSEHAPQKKIKNFQNYILTRNSSNSQSTCYTSSSKNKLSNTLKSTFKSIEIQKSQKQIAPNSNSHFYQVIHLQKVQMDNEESQVLDEKDDIQLQKKYQNSITSFDQLEKNFNLEQIQMNQLSQQQQKCQNNNHQNFSDLEIQQKEYVNNLYSQKSPKKIYKRFIRQKSKSQNQGFKDQIENNDKNYNSNQTLNKQQQSNSRNKSSIKKNKNFENNQNNKKTSLEKILEQFEQQDNISNTKNILERDLVIREWSALQQGDSHPFINVCFLNKMILTNPQ